MSKQAMFRRWGRAILAQLSVLVVTLIVLDVALILTGLFPPTANPGIAKIGWVAAPATGKMESSGCFDFDENRGIRFPRNEDGHRTGRSRDVLTDEGPLFEIAVSGDSHTDICSTNEEAHFGVMEAGLTEAGLETAVYAYGAGRYSPLQAYLAMKETIDRNRADAFVLNLYSGNDLYDIIRIDDRPHFVPSDDGLAIADPVWFQYDAPGTVRRSRVLHALRSLASAVGVRDLWIRLKYLRGAAAAQGEGLGSVIAYVSDLRKSRSPEVGYSGAFAAQILNQQLFFHHFPGASTDALARMTALMKMIRAENPDMLLVLSPIPSYQAVDGSPVDNAFLDVIDRLPVTYEDGVALEEGLLAELRSRAEAEGWLYVDNLQALRAYDGDQRLFNDFDYHILPVASEIIGSGQVEAILRYRDMAQEGTPGG